MPTKLKTEIPVDVRKPHLYQIRFSGYIPVQPTPKQHAFLLLDDREAFYGGSGRGGKSWALLMAALQYVDQPDYTALLLRRTYPQLSIPEGILDIAKKWLLPHSEIHFDNQTKTFTFPSGARLKFGYLQTANDIYNYHSASFHFVGFDEVTDFSEQEYLYLFTRQSRNAGCRIPLRMRAASNPVGLGFDWVKERFISGKNKDIPFIPARLDDNPYVDREEYIRSLDKVDPITREKILNGDWEVRQEAMMFKQVWFRTIPTVPPGVADAVRMWDLAGTPEKAGADPSYTAGVLMGRTHDNLFPILDIIRFRGSPKEVEETVKNTAIRDGKGVDVCIEQEGGSSGKSLIDHYTRNVLLGWTVRPIPPTGSKVARATPVASYMEKGYVPFVARTLTSEVLDEFLMFPLGRHGDVVDATAHAFNTLASRPMRTSPIEVYKSLYKEKRYLNWGGRAEPVKSVIINEFED